MSVEVSTDILDSMDTESLTEGVTFEFTLTEVRALVVWPTRKRAEKEE